MTTPSDAPAKLPLMKRIVIAVRGGVGGGISAMLVAVVVGLLIALVAGGFLAGSAYAMHRNQAMQQLLTAQTKAAKAALAKAQKAKEEIEKELTTVKELYDVQSKDNKLLKDDLERARLEKETTEKVMADFRESLKPAAGNDKSAVKTPPAGATLKFGNKDCDVQGSAVKSKADVKCLDLKNAIDSMNNGPGGYNKPTGQKGGEAKPEASTHK